MRERLVIATFAGQYITDKRLVIATCACQYITDKS